MYAHLSLTILDEQGEVTAIFMIPGKHSTADHISSSIYDCMHFLDLVKYVENMCSILFPFIEHISVLMDFFLTQTQEKNFCLDEDYYSLNENCLLTYWSDRASVFEKKNAAYVLQM